MKTTNTLLAIAALLGCATAKDQRAGKRRLGDPNYFSSATPEENAIEILDTSQSLSGKFAAGLFGREWGARKMEYFGGDEFIQMYDDHTETRIVIRGYIDLSVDSIEVSSHKNDVLKDQQGQGSNSSTTTFTIRVSLSFRTEKFTMSTET